MLDSGAHLSGWSPLSAPEPVLCLRILQAALVYVNTPMLQDLPVELAEAGSRRIARPPMSSGGPLGLAFRTSVHGYRLGEARASE